MTRALLRTNFNSSRLIRFLADLSIEGGAESQHSQQAFAERLGQWLGVADAITLHAAHSAGAANVQAVRQSGASAAVEVEFARIRTALANSITKSCSPNAFDARITWPMPKSGAGNDAKEVNEAKELVVAYEPYHRFYLAHQREMDASLRPLRAKLRAALAKASPALRQLAALDAALDQILSEREGKLLATVPVLLEKRFAQLLEAHRQTLLQKPVDTRQADDPAAWMLPGGWLAGFCKDLQGVLLAELDVRLQPAVGLIEAFSNEANEANEPNE